MYIWVSPSIPCGGLYIFALFFLRDEPYLFAHTGLVSVITTVIKHTYLVQGTVWWNITLWHGWPFLMFSLLPRTHMLDKTSFLNLYYVIVITCHLHHGSLFRVCCGHRKKIWNLRVDKHITIWLGLEMLRLCIMICSILYYLNRMGWKYHITVNHTLEKVLLIINFAC